MLSPEGKKLSSLRVALVHDWLLSVGGAEKVLKSFQKIFPDAPIYTLLYDKKFTDRFLTDARIVPSFLQKIPNIKKLYPWFKVLMPSAVESFNFDGFDLVISSSHEFSHGIITKPGTKHISYFHSPARLLWDRTHQYVNDFKVRGRGRVKLLLIRLGQHFLRLWDYQAGKRADIVIANSRHVAARIRKYYGREAKVIYPPVEMRAAREHPVRSFSGAPAAPSEVRSRFASLRSDQAKTASESARQTLPRGSTSSYFLIVSQLFPHKNIDLAIEAFEKIPELNLVIIGEGPEYKNLKLKIKNLKLNNVKLLKFVPDEELPDYYQNCLAYMVLNEEDFGIAPVEAMSFGKPVLAFNKGGVKETVIDGITGEFFDRPLLAEAVKNIFEKAKNGYFSPLVIKKQAERFDSERFKREIVALLNKLGYNWGTSFCEI